MAIVVVAAVVVCAAAADVVGIVFDSTDMSENHVFG